MKKRILFLTVALIALFSCSKSPLPGGDLGGYFEGTVTVRNPDGNDFVDNGIKLDTGIDEDGKLVILMHAVKFAKAMPVRIDMTIKDIVLGEDGTITAEKTVPEAMGGPFEKYTITNLNGKISSDKNGNYTAVSFDMMCGSYPTSYEGTYHKFMQE